MMHKVPEIERSLEIIKYLSKSRGKNYGYAR